MRVAREPAAGSELRLLRLTGCGGRGYAVVRFRRCFAGTLESRIRSRRSARDENTVLDAVFSRSRNTVPHGVSVRGFLRSSRSLEPSWCSCRDEACVVLCTHGRDVLCTHGCDALERELEIQPFSRISFCRKKSVEHAITSGRPRVLPVLIRPARAYVGPGSRKSTQRPGKVSPTSSKRDLAAS